MMTMLVLLCAVITTAAGTSAPVTHAPHTTQGHQQPDVMQMIRSLQQEFDTLKGSMKKTISDLSRHVMLQQLFAEERVRTDGSSGVKQIRMGPDATKSYFVNTYAGGSIGSIHDHTNYDRTIGMGELDVVLNGVEFRTRHNDYKLVMPAHNGNFEQVEDIPFPAVPPSVLAKRTVPEQINEMRQYFKAFNEQNFHRRDYRPYFKPVMCYLEGGWMSDADHIHEPFKSDRHFIDAKDLRDLQDKMMYLSHTGGKNIFENISYLPKTIINITEYGMPVYAQWNYRILCHPINETLYLKDFALVDDLATRMHIHKNMTMLGRSKGARFSLPYKHGYGFNKKEGYGKHSEGAIIDGLVDKIMYEIPGKDNYGVNLTDNTFEALKYKVVAPPLTVLNVGKYHRMYRQNRAGAMGLTIRHRGFSDPNLFVSKTTRPEVVSVAMTDCPYNSHLHRKVCTRYESRHTYAFPLEIIWLTPLYEWNPYNLTHHTGAHMNAVVTKGGRNGGTGPTKAYNGTSQSIFYRTPAEFFHGGEVGRDPADTAKDSVGVLDQNGVVRHVSASGTRIFTPEIPGIGKMRMRYPVMPVHAEGSVNYKNIFALQDIVMDMKHHTNMFETKPEIRDVTHAPDQFHTGTTHRNPPGMHYHDVYLTSETVAALNRNGTTVTVFTTEDNGHQHQLVIRQDPAHLNRPIIVSCDGQPHCWDGHNNFLYKQY